MYAPAPIVCSIYFPHCVGSYYFVNGILPRANFWQSSELSAKFYKQQKRITSNSIPLAETSNNICATMLGKINFVAELRRHVRRLS